MANRK